MLKGYFQDRRLVFSILIICCGSLFGIGYLYRIPTSALSYVSVFAGTFVAILLLLDFFRYISSWKELERLCDQKTWHKGMFYSNPGALEAWYREMIEKMQDDMFHLLEDHDITMKKMMDYYGLWAHQIKTPIAAMRLLLQSRKQTIRTEEEKEHYDALSMELFKIEQYVEMALSYLKIGDISKDMILQEYDVGSIVRQAVKKYSRLFILQKIGIRMEEIKQSVVTDEKWLLFVLEQLLSNALKYTKEGSISIYMKEKGILVIEDSGIGIAPEDLPRIMEKGFTGYNGRRDKKSTGLGLYLCRSILDKLNHQIRIESEVGKGTKVFLDLNREPLEVE